MSFVGQNPKFKTQALEDLGVNSTPNPPSGYHKVVNRSGKIYLKDSSGVESGIGSGAGEINALTTGSQDSTQWTTGTGISTVATDTSNSPLSPIISTSLAVTGSAGVVIGSQTSAYGAVKSITMPSGLKNRKLKVEFSFTTPASSLGTWAVSVYQGSTRVPLSTDSSGDTILPAGVTGGKFTAYFDTDSSSSYTVNIVQRTFTSSNTIYLTNIIVGPGIQPQGAVVGEWQSFSSQPTVAGLGTGSGTVTSRYQRIGSTMRLMVSFLKDGSSGTGTSDITVALPSGFTLNNSALHNTSINAVGSGSYRNSSNQFIPLSVYTDGSLFYFRIGGTANLRGQDLIATTGNFTFEVEVPISEWAGSGTVNLAQNDVEYAYNTGNVTAAGGSDTTNFGYGPAGTPLLGINSTTSNSVTSFRVQFQTPIQTTDRLDLEFNSGTGGAGWNTATDYFPYIQLNTSQYGAVVYAIGTNTAQVDFGNQGNRPAGAASYAASGQSWSSLSGYKWRVRKSSAGAAVGFGIVQPGVSSGLVSASGLPGNTTGNAIASGYVGERLAPLTETFSVSVSNTGAGSEFKSLTLTAGVWMVYGFAVAQTGTLSGPQYSTLVLTTTSNSFSAVDNREGACQLTISGNSFGSLILQCVRYINLSSSQTVYLCGRQGATSGSSTWTDLNGRSMYAIRIA